MFAFDGTARHIVLHPRFHRMSRLKPALLDRVASRAISLLDQTGELKHASQSANLCFCPLGVADNILIRTVQLASGRVTYFGLVGVSVASTVERR